MASMGSMVILDFNEVSEMKMTPFPSGSLVGYEFSREPNIFWSESLRDCSAESEGAFDPLELIGEESCEIAANGAAHLPNSIKRSLAKFINFG